MVRGSGKYKVKRGGGRQFTAMRDMTLDEDGVAVDKWSRREKNEVEDESGEEKGEGEEEEEEEDAEENEESAAGNSKGIVPLTAEEIAAARSARKEEKKAKAAAGGLNDEDADLPVNANRLPVKNMAISDINTPRELSSKERGAKEKQEAKERYWNLHQQGKTDQAKADLARLAQIRKQREEAAATRKAADEAKAAEAEVKRKR